jgi:N-acetylmuramoyl-L-alanine amidase
MNFKFIPVLILLLYSFSIGQVNINVIYPISGQQLPLVDSTFILGNVPPKTDLNINGIPVKVHKEGGWLAFLPVTPGEFEFDIVAVTGNDTTELALPVQIGPVKLIDLGKRPRIPSSPYPDSDIAYTAGDLFRFSFKAPPGGIGWFRVGASDSVRMYEDNGEPYSIQSSVFGDISSNIMQSPEYVEYSGYYRLGKKDIGLHAVSYWFYPNGGSVPGGFITRKNTTDVILTVMPELPPVIGELRGASQIIRTGVRKGYKLLYMPAGIKVWITGAERGFYKLRLGAGITGYVNIDSVTVLPPGPKIPSSEVSYITVNETADYAEISCNTKEKLPYEVNESPESKSIDIDLFGVTADVDWIRYNTSGDFIKIVKWSQPRDDIFRITVELNEEYISGYQAFYDSTTFVFRIGKNPKLRRWPHKPLSGVKIVVDPGHSHDSGAIGPTALREEDANLWIAHELRQMLLDEGAEVIMTRYGHEHIPLYDRPKIAIRWDADLLISIHNNALPDGVNPFVNNGVSVYYYHPHSQPLAEAIHKRMLERIRLPDHGLYYGNLVLTRPPEMPAVLVECAFMMIPEQEAMLKTDKFQRKCARAITDGIKDYLKLSR